MSSNGPLPPPGRFPGALDTAARSFERSGPVEDPIGDEIDRDGECCDGAGRDQGSGNSENDAALEEGFSWIRTIADQDPLPSREPRRMAFSFAAAAYNLVRLPMIMAETG